MTGRASLVAACPVCDSTAIKGFLSRSYVPVHQNLLMSTYEEARSTSRGDLDLGICEECGFVFNRAFDLEKLSYGAKYDNTQSCSGWFDSYLDGLVHELIEREGIRNRTIVEVGCGKGDFLRKLVTYPDASNRGYGFDPSYVGPEEALDGLLRFKRRYYGADCSDIVADVVVCRHVIEHVPNPQILLKAVHAALAGSPHARVFFETPCVEWILRNQVIWDFFYEHCSLFSATSLRLAFERCGFAVEKVGHVFGGQYLWLEARLAQEGHVLHAPSGVAETVALVEAFSIAEREAALCWGGQLERFAAKGRVALWGGGAKGATFANLVDPDCRLIDCVVDLNPKKQGQFVPGTGHPIVAPMALASRGVSTAILMNPNYRDENLQFLAGMGIAVDLIDWS